MIARLFIAAILFIPGIASGAPTAPQSAAITGQILKPNGTPAINERVAALAANEGAGAESLISITQTDTSGRYRLEQVPPGRYVIMAGPIEAPVYFPGVRTRKDAMIVTVGDGAPLGSFDFKVGFVVSGKIVHEGGRAPFGFEPRLVFTNRTGTNLSASVAEDGSFEFRYLWPGAYQVMLGPTHLVDITVVDKDISGLKIVSPKARIGGRISGIPSGVSPDSIGMTVQLAQQPPTRLARPVSRNGVLTPIQPDGAFEFLDVSPGEYQIVVTYGGGSTSSRVSVIDTDQQNIEMRLPRLGLAEIHIEGGGSLPAPTPPIGVFLSRGDFLPGRPQLIAQSRSADNVRVASGVMDRKSVVSSAGLFLFPSLAAGEYWIALNALPTGWFVKSMTYGDLDLLQGPLRVMTDSDPASIPVIQVTLTPTRPASAPPGVQLIGRVIGLRAGSDPSAGVVTIQRTTLAPSMAGFTNFTLVRADGTFEIPDIAPGTYTLTLSFEEPGARPRASFDRMAATSTSIVVAGQDVLDIEIPASASLPLSKLSCNNEYVNCFDGERRILLEGEIKQINFQFPGVTGLLRVMDEKGTRDIDFGAPNPNVMAEAGFGPNRVKVGDRVRVVVNPRRDGGEGAFIAAFVGEDGKEVSVCRPGVCLTAALQ